MRWWNFSVVITLVIDCTNLITPVNKQDSENRNHNCLKIIFSVEDDGFLSQPQFLVLLSRELLLFLWNFLSNAKKSCDTFLLSCLPFKIHNSPFSRLLILLDKVNAIMIKSKFCCWWSIAINFFFFFRIWIVISFYEPFQILERLVETC